MRLAERRLRRDRLQSHPAHQAPDSLAIDRMPLPARRQCALLGLNRSSWYTPEPAGNEREENLRLMHRIDELYTA
jgi:hypothetical protein